MTTNRRDRRCWCLGWGAALLLAGSALAAESGRKPVRVGRYNPKAQTVEMFAAMENGDIAVRLVPWNALLCRILVENKTDEPLNVELPKAFVGVPVSAQRPGEDHPISDRDSGSGDTQNLGGGMGGYGSIGKEGVLDIHAKQVGQFNVSTVCLDHDKEGPLPGAAYEIKRADRVAVKLGVGEVCELLGNGKIDQQVAQGVAWHLNNKLGWEQLAAERIPSAHGKSRPYFSQKEIEAGKVVAAQAVKTAKERRNPQPSYPSSSANPTK